VPAVREVLHHVALALAVLALAQAALRIATLAAPRGLERLIAAVVLGVAIAVAEALGLGLVGLGGNTVALAAAAGLTWAATLAVLPPPALPPSGELATWWRGLAAAQRVGAAALCGLGGAWAVWQLLNFSIGFDSALYHYPFVAGWIDNGSPGSDIQLNYDIPYVNYPLTDEVAQTWLAGISRSWVPFALWNPLLLTLLAAAGWLTLRNLSVSRAVSGLATAALVTAPVIVRQLNEPQTDLPSLAWLACAAALATGAARRPTLLVPAVVAAGLAIGTKPSAAPMAVAVLGVGAYLARGRLRPLAGWLVLALAAAYVVGGLWYTRNLIDHGSPLWPFAAAPWGDEEPRFLALVNETFLSRPLATLDGQLDEFAERLGGTWLLLLGALGALAYGALAPRARPVRGPLLAAGAFALAGCLIWSIAWSTGLPTSRGLAWPAGFPISSLRYLLPAIGAASVAVAVVARSGGVIGAVATGLLVVSLAWNLVEVVQLGSPWTPPAVVPALGVLAGVASLGVAALARPLAAALEQRLPGWGIALAAALVVGGLLGASANGFVERYTDVDRTTAYGPELVSWFVEQPGFEDGDWPIAIASRGVPAQLAGDHLRHPLMLLPQRASCREVERIARRMPVVVTHPVFLKGFQGVESYSGYRCLSRHAPALDRDPFYVYRL
jgi:hypothetical protein